MFEYVKPSESQVKWDHVPVLKQSNKAGGALNLP